MGVRQYGDISTHWASLTDGGALIGGPRFVFLADRQSAVPSGGVVFSAMEKAGYAGSWSQSRWAPSISA